MAWQATPRDKLSHCGRAAELLLPIRAPLPSAGMNTLELPTEVESVNQQAAL